MEVPNTVLFSHKCHTSVETVETHCQRCHVAYPPKLFLLICENKPMCSSFAEHFVTVINEFCVPEWSSDSTAHCLHLHSFCLSPVSHFMDMPVSFPLSAGHWRSLHPFTTLLLLKLYNCVLCHIEGLCKFLCHPGFRSVKYIWFTM